MNSVSAGPQASSANPGPGAPASSVDARRPRAAGPWPAGACTAAPARARAPARPTRPPPGRPAPCRRWSAPARRGGGPRRPPPQHGLAAGEQVAGQAGQALARGGRDSVRLAAAAGAGGHHARRIGGQLGGHARPTAPASPTSCTVPGGGRAERAQHHPRLDRPVPAVALEARRPRPAGWAPAAASERWERRKATPRARAPPLDQREARVLALLAHGGHVLDARGGHQQARRGVAGAERAQPLQLLGQVQRQRAAGHDRVDALGRRQVRRAPAPRRRGRPARRGRRRRARPRSPARPPSGGRRSRSGARRRRPGRRAGRTAAMLRPEPRPRVAVEGDDHGRAAGSARPAARPRCRPRRGASPPRPPPARPACSCGSAQRLGLVQDALLGLAPVVVEPVELARDLGRALGILGEHQLERGVGALQAAGGVDPRAEPEPGRLGVHVARLEVGHRASAPAGPALRVRGHARPCPGARCGGSRRAAAPCRTRWPGRPGRGPASARAGSRPGGGVQRAPRA